MSEQSPLTFDELIKRISEDSHVLLDKLHGKIESLSLASKAVVPAVQNNKSDEFAATYDHPHILLLRPEPEPKATTAAPAATITA